MNRDFLGLVRAIVLLVLVALVTLLCKSEQELKEIGQGEPVTEATAGGREEPTPRIIVAQAAPVLQEPAPEPVPANDPAPEPEAEARPVRYPLTDEERAVVEAVVAAEARGEDFDGQRLVAQCILNTAEARSMRPDAVVLEKGQYAPPNYDSRHLVSDAVSAVFDDGYMVTDEPVRFFYAPKRCTSKWHESLTFVVEHGGHRFFKE